MAHCHLAIAIYSMSIGKILQPLPDLLYGETLVVVLLSIFINYNFTIPQGCACAVNSFARFYK